jgi:hypothetical protein
MQKVKIRCTDEFYKGRTKRAKKSSKSNADPERSSIKRPTGTSPVNLNQSKNSILIRNYTATHARP